MRSFIGALWKHDGKIRTAGHVGGGAVMKLINIGCGEVFHPDWVNLAVAPVSPEVRRLDARRPLPFGDGEVDAVYHSHVLEHLSAEDGARFLAECFRVLRTGGVVRVAVPGLEGIARAYLAALEVAEAGGDATLYDWCRMELTDQLTRTVSGGEMAPWLLKLTPEQQAVVGQRAGREMTGILAAAGKRRKKRIGGLLLAKAVRRAHVGFVRALVGMSGGARMVSAFDEGVFRQRGEVHRLMYDKYSLARALRDAGFSGARPVTADESGITGFAGYGLDAVGGEVRKPDSLFMEAVKP